MFANEKIELWGHNMMASKGDRISFLMSSLMLLMTLEESFTPLGLSFLVCKMKNLTT